MKEKWHYSYRRSLERRKNDIVNIDGANSGIEMALFILKALEEEKEIAYMLLI